MSRSNPRRRSLRLASLDDSRLVDLVAGLLYSAADWVVLRRDDHRASADACEITGREAAGPALFRTWMVKTLRAEQIGADALALAVRQCLDPAENVPDVLLFVLTCDCAESVRERFRLQASLLGVAQPILWTREELEVRLSDERPDLLFTYFGISSFKRAKRVARTLRRRIAIKHRLLRDLVIAPAERPDMIVQPFEKLRFSKVLIRSIDDHTYPESSRQLGHIRGWMEVGTYDLYHDGLEVILGTIFVAVDGDGHWSPVAARDIFDATRYRRIRAFEVGRIPFENIVDYDLTGDEYFAAPHVFCFFANAGLPFSEYRYYAVEEPYRHRLRPELMLGPEAVPGAATSLDAPARPVTARRRSH